MQFKINHQKKKSFNAILCKILFKFLNLLETQIFINSNSNLNLDLGLNSGSNFIFALDLDLDSGLTSDSDSELWKQFALWANFSISLNFKIKFKNYCCILQSKVSNAYKIEILKNPLNDYTNAI